MKKLVLFATVASLLSLISITDPLDRIYNENTLSQDLAAILAQDTPDSSAYKRINKYLLVMAFSEEQLTGKTYRQLLELYELWDVQQKIQEAKEKAREEQAAREQANRYESLRKVVSVVLTDWEVVHGDSTLSLSYFYTLKNKSRKSVRAVRGMVEVNHGLYAYFWHVDLTFTQPLSARSSRREKMTFSKTSAPLNAQKETGKLIWRPEMILFEDGEKLD